MRIGKNRKLFTHLLPLAILLTATIGAGIADMAYSDTIPIRPYTAQFKFVPISMIGRASVLGDVLVVALALVLIASLVAAVASRTTGIIIAHTGGPAVNLNLTGSPGVASTLPLYPLIFAFLGLIFVARHLKRQEAGV